MNDKIRKLAVAAAYFAGEELLDRYKKFNRKDEKFKSAHEIVTAADLAAEKIILATIKKAFPLHEILSEEAGKSGRNSDYLWVVDPLDGTHNFSFHNPLWAVSIAVFYKQEIILGVIFAPVLNELYVAEKDSGAWLNGQRISVSKIRGAKSMNAFCHSSQKKDIKKSLKYYNYHKLKDLDIRQLGSAALELSYVAAGRLESIYIPGANSWDVAAGALLVREAGGKVTDANNKDWKIGSRELLGSNKAVHNGLLKVIQKLK
jgi:myo-inositol-1(or 4)-monophosphatase